MQRSAYFVEEDSRQQNAAKQLLESDNVVVHSVPVISEFIKIYDSDSAGCLIFNLGSSKRSGVEIKRHLQRMGIYLPCIVLVPFTDIVDAVTSVREGIFNYFSSPINDIDLAQSVLEALKQDLGRIVVIRNMCSYQSRYNCLSPREIEVMDLVYDGKTSKQIAQHLGIGEKTVETHRSRVMMKMQAGGIPDLIHMLNSLKSGLRIQCDTCRRKTCDPAFERIEQE